MFLHFQRFFAFLLAIVFFQKFSPFQNRPQTFQDAIFNSGRIDKIDWNRQNFYTLGKGTKVDCFIFKDFFIYTLLVSFDHTSVSKSVANE